MKNILSLLLIAGCFTGCATAPNQRIETIPVLGEVRKFRSAGTQVVLNADFRNPDRSELYFDCLDITILKPEAYQGTKLTLLLAFAGGPYTEIKRPGIKVFVSVNKQAVVSKEPDWTVYRLEDLKIKGEANQALVPTPMSVTPAADAPVAPATGAAHL